VAVEDVRQTRQDLAGTSLERELVLDDDARRLVPGVRPDPRAHRGRAVAGVVAREDGEALVDESADHMQVAAGVLAEPVHDLHDPARCGGGHVQPCLDLVATVRGGEGDLVQGHGVSSCRGAAPLRTAAVSLAVGRIRALVS